MMIMKLSFVVALVAGSSMLVWGQSLPPLTYVGDDGKWDPLVTYPLDACLGDCDNDDDCAGDFECFKEAGVLEVPGCSGERPMGSKKLKDFCFDPSFEEGAENPTDPSPGETPEGSPLAYVTLGTRPYFLVRSMDESDLKTMLEECAAETTEFFISDFSIGHRGACMQYPEHTVESYIAAGQMGAGIIECDVTFTQDRQLICRHAQCDLHTTTDVVLRPELNAKCTTPWSPGVDPTCCASDFTLAEIKSMCGKMDSSGPNDGTAEDYVYGGTADWRTDLYQYECPTIPTHAESIELIKAAGGKFTPELKSPDVEMPFEGDYTQEMYAQQMIDEYIAAGVPPEDVWPQSFNEFDVYYWVDNTDYGAQAVSLDDQYERTQREVDEYLDRLVAGGVNIVAPPMWRLVDPDESSPYKMQPSGYALAAQERGLDIITWTLERTDPGLQGWYWTTLNEAGVELVDGDKYNLLFVLSEEVGILGMFSDWPATTTFYANCMGISLRAE